MCNPIGQAFFLNRAGTEHTTHPRPVRRTRLPVHQIFASAGHGLCREGQGPRAQTRSAPSIWRTAITGTSCSTERSARDRQGSQACS
jgi:hypothetical protein